MTFRRTALCRRRTTPRSARATDVPVSRAPLDGLRVARPSRSSAPGRSARSCSPISAPRSSRSRTPRSAATSPAQVGPYAADGDSLYFQSFNRGKKSLTLDLKHPDGQAVLHDLVRVSHAVYNNLRGDLPAKLGLTYDALRAVNPAVVCCSLSGFGATGPRAAEPAFDYLIQGYAGWMSVTGEPGRAAGQVRRVGRGLRRRLRLDGALLAGLWDAQRTRRRARHRHLAARHRGEHALLLRDLDAQPRLAGRPRRRLRPPVAGAGAELPHRATAGSSSSATRPSSGRRWSTRWSCPSSRATPASPPSPTGSPTRTRWCRSSRRASPSARPRRGSARLRGRVPCAPGEHGGPGAGRRAGARARDDRGGRASALRPAARGRLAGEDRRRRHAPRRPPPAWASTPRRSCASILQYDAARIAAVRASGALGADRPQPPTPEGLVTRPRCRIRHGRADPADPRRGGHRRDGDRGRAALDDRSCTTVTVTPSSRS